MKERPRYAEIAEAYDRLKKLAQAVRAAQKKYFSTRAQEDLRVARDYERRLDAELQRTPRDPPPVQQPVLNLFGGATA